SIPLEQVAKYVTLERAELVDAELRAGRAVVLVLSHLGSWEVLAQIFGQHFGHVPLASIFQPLGNRYIDADVRRTRERGGIKLLDRREGFQQAIAILREGGVIGVLSDQHAGDHGLWTPFFGRLASTTPLPGLLARRTGAAVISAAILTDAPARWRMIFSERISGAGDSVESITAKANDAIAHQIRTAPEDWFWVHNRWKTPRPNFLLAKYKRGVYVPSEHRMSDLQQFRILIRGTNWLGDSVISAAAVRAIKRGRPDAHITVAAPAKLAAVWRLVPEVDEVLGLPDGGLMSVVSLLKKQQPFEVAVLLPNSLRAALEVWLAGIPRRVGFAGHHRAWLLNQVVPEPPRTGPISHQVNRYLHLAETLGAVIDTAAQPVVRPTQNGAGPMKIGLCPGAEYGPAKRWLTERFAEVATAVAGERAVQWILFGTVADAKVGGQIAAVLGERCTNRIGQTTLDELIAELRECALLLTNDTGTMHLATLLGVPVVAVFGSTEPRLTGPLRDDNVVIRHHVECSPCFLRECPIDFRCMHAVTSEEVTARVLEKLPS
ncbi:MAG TPA: lipopolysaccharide heptosyltransferase II, partial [Chthoniobacterales bacterium]